MMTLKQFQEFAGKAPERAVRIWCVVRAGEIVEDSLAYSKDAAGQNLRAGDAVMRLADALIEQVQR